MSSRSRTSVARWLALGALGAAAMVWWRWQAPDATRAVEWGAEGAPPADAAGAPGGVAAMEPPGAASPGGPARHSTAGASASASPQSADPARAIERKVRLQIADLATGVDRWRRARRQQPHAAAPSIEELRSWDRALLAHSAWIALTRGQPGPDEQAELAAFALGDASRLDPALLESTADYLGRTHLEMLLELDVVVSDPDGAAFDVRRRAAIAERVWTLAKVSVGNSNDIAESRLLRAIEDPQVPTARILRQLEEARRAGDRHLAAYGARQLAAAQGVRDLTPDEAGRLRRLERRLERQKEHG